MFHVGVSGKMTTETADEDDNFGTEQSHKVSFFFYLFFFTIKFFYVVNIPESHLL